MSHRKLLAFLLVNLLIAFAIVELVLVSFLSMPGIVRVSPRAIRMLVQQVYRHFDRSLIQFDPACAQYDPGVTYTLKPGSCTFANREFSTEVHVNHLGLRDDETALVAPDIILLGDSHAMGWGVSDNQTMARVLALKTGLKVLDAGVSSYGTVRELLMLDRLDTSRLKALVIQYSDNDVVENEAFKRNGDHLPITSERDYDAIVSHYAGQRRYYPGKFIYRLFMKVLRLEEPEPDQVKMDPVTPSVEAELFIHVLTHAGRTKLDGLPLIVFEINEQIAPPRPFIAALEEVRQRPEHPPFVRQLVPLDVSPRLTQDDFYTLDDHMRPHGHQVVGEALAQLLAGVARSGGSGR